MNRKLDWFKLKFSEKVITTEEALKDVEPFNLDENIKIKVTGDNDNIKSLQERLNQNMNKSVKLAEKNTIRNENGEVVFTKDEIDDMEEFLGLDKIKPINMNIEVDDFNDYYNEELKDTYVKMIKVGEEFKETLGISDDEVYDLLKNKNKLI